MMVDVKCEDGIYYFPYGSYLREESRDKDYIRVVSDTPPPCSYSEGVIDEGSCDVIDIYWVRKSDKVGIPFIILNMWADYGEDVVRWLLETHNMSYPAALEEAKEVFFDRENGSLALRRGAFLCYPTYFRLRKLLFAHLQDVAWRETEKFINYKSGLLPFAVRIGLAEDVARRILLSDFTEWRDKDVEATMEALNVKAERVFPGVFYYGACGTIDEVIDRYIEGKIDRIEGYRGSNLIDVGDEYEIQEIYADIHGKFIYLTCPSTWASTVTVIIYGEDLKVVGMEPDGLAEESCEVNSYEDFEKGEADFSAVYI